MFQFQPTSKIYFNRKQTLVMMIAGDPALEMELLNELVGVEHEWDSAHPGTAWPLSRAADAYRRCYAEAKRKRVEALILRPLGLDSESFITRSAAMSQSLVRDLRFEIDHFEMPGVGTIIAGLDGDGTHLYEADGPAIRCADADGLAVIGSGSVHALSELANAGHRLNDPAHVGLITTYAAKKRAEIAPTVGSSTDMFVLAQGSPGYYPVPPETVDKLDAIYQEWAKGERYARGAAIQATEALLEATTPPVPASSPASTPPPETRHDRQLPPP